MGSIESAIALPASARVTPTRVMFIIRLCCIYLGYINKREESTQSHIHGIQTIKNQQNDLLYDSSNKPYWTYYATTYPELLQVEWNQVALPLRLNYT